MEKKRQRVAAEKTVYTVGYLRSVSWHALKEAQENERGSYLNLMVSLVFSAFTIEAYLNHLGSSIIPFWSTIEKNLSTSKKLEILAAQLAKPIDYGRRPFQSFKSIFRLRNFLAHGKTEYLTEESIQDLAEGDKPELPKAEWQRQITIENVQLYFDDTKDIIDYLHVASGLDFNPLLVPETAGWLISPVDDSYKNS